MQVHFVCRVRAFGQSRPAAQDNMTDIATLSPSSQKYHTAGDLKAGQHDYIHNALLCLGWLAAHTLVKIL